MVNKEQVYADTVEIVKSAVGNNSESNSLLLNQTTLHNIATLIKIVYASLTEINK